MFMKQIFIIRIVIGAIFFVFLGEKLLQARENFLYVVQNYDVLRNPFLEQLVTYVFPWIEFVLGGFLILGLWTRLALWGVGTCSLTFMVFISQALIRKLPIQECGCFGSLLPLPLPATLTLDTAIVVSVIVLLRNISQASNWSLDTWLNKKS